MIPPRFFGIVSLGVSIDQLTKLAAQKYLSFYSAIEVIPQTLFFQLVHNYGAAYGIFQHQRLFLLIVSGCVIIGSLFFRKKIAPTSLSSFGLQMLLIGAIGNFIDRLLLGYVVDFINIQIIPVFNIADIAINIGVLCFIGDIFINKNAYTHTN